MRHRVKGLLGRIAQLVRPPVRGAVERRLLLQSPRADALQGRAKIARMLIDNGIDPNSIHADGFTPIHRACSGRDVRHAETVRVFLEAGVPWDFAAKNGQTPLAMCKQRGHPMAVKALEEWREKSQKEL